MNNLSHSWNDDGDDNKNAEEDLLGLKNPSPQADDDTIVFTMLQDMKSKTRSFDDVEEAAALVANHDPLLIYPPPPPVDRGTIRPPVTARPPRRPKTVLMWTGIAVGGLIVLALFVTLIVLLAQAKKTENDGPVDAELWTQQLVTLHLLGIPELIRDFTLLGRIEAVCNDFLLEADAADEGSSGSQFCELQTQALRQSFLQLLLRISVKDHGGKPGKAAPFKITDESLLQQNQTAWVAELRMIDPFFDSLTTVTLKLLPDFPTVAPSSVPSLEPSPGPSAVPSSAPSLAPSPSPTGAPTTVHPTIAPSSVPSLESSAPSSTPSKTPTRPPTN